jgi:large subunit ribosomal protein L40e
MAKRAGSDCVMKNPKLLVNVFGYRKFRTPYMPGFSHNANFPAEVSRMPIADVAKKQLAQRYRLHYKVCRNCGARNPASGDRCRKCRSPNLRWKKRELGAK